MPMIMGRPSILLSYPCWLSSPRSRRCHCSPIWSTARLHLLPATSVIIEKHIYENVLSDYGQASIHICTFLIGSVISVPRVDDELNGIKRSDVSPVYILYI